VLSLNGTRGLSNTRAREMDSKTKSPLSLLTRVSTPRHRGDKYDITKEVNKR